MRKTFYEGKWQIDFMPLSNGNLFIEIGHPSMVESSFIQIKKDEIPELIKFLNDLKDGGLDKNT